MQPAPWIFSTRRPGWLEFTPEQEETADVHDHDDHQHDDVEPVSLTRSAVAATLHCLTGCAIGEVLGMVLATALGWGNVASVAVSIVLAFLFGYWLTIR